MSEVGLDDESVIQHKDTGDILGQDTSATYENVQIHAMTMFTVITLY
jgi:hypothetical protein